MAKTAVGCYILSVEPQSDEQLKAARLWSQREDSGSIVLLFGVVAVFVAAVGLAAYVTANWSEAEPKYVAEKPSEPDRAPRPAAPSKPAEAEPAEPAPAPKPVILGAVPLVRNSSPAPARGKAAPARAAAAATPKPPAAAPNVLPKNMPEKGRGEWSALFTRPMEYLVAHTWLGSGDKLARLARNHGSARRYLERPLVRTVLHSPMLLNLLTSNRTIVGAVLKTPAMQDPRAVQALLGSPLMHDILTSPAVKGLLSNPIAVANTLGNEEVSAWLRKNPVAMSTISSHTGGALPASAAAGKRR